MVPQFLPLCCHMFVYCNVRTLGVWGELASHKRLLNPMKVSMLGIHSPNVVVNVCLISVFYTVKVKKTFTVQPLNVVHPCAVYPFPPKRRSTVCPLTVHDRAL